MPVAATQRSVVGGAGPRPCEIAGDDLLEHGPVLLARQPHDHTDPIADANDASLVDWRARDAMTIHVGAVHAVEVFDQEAAFFHQ